MRALIATMVCVGGVVSAFAAEPEEVCRDAAAVLTQSNPWSVSVSGDETSGFEWTVGGASGTCHVEGGQVMSVAFDGASVGTGAAADSTFECESRDGRRHECGILGPRLRADGGTVVHCSLRRGAELGRVRIRRLGRRRMPRSLRTGLQSGFRRLVRGFVERGHLVGNLHGDLREPRQQARDLRSTGRGTVRFASSCPTPVASLGRAGAPTATRCGSIGDAGRCSKSSLRWWLVDLPDHLRVGGGRREECALRGRGRAQVHRQLSNTRCEPGTTYGVDGTTLWVKAGAAPSSRSCPRSRGSGSGGRISRGTLPLTLAEKGAAWSVTDAVAVAVPGIRGRSGSRAGAAPTRPTHRARARAGARAREDASREGRCPCRCHRHRHLG
jgi:hypothetical protein